jgi:superfamily I DNA and RNA helicase
MLLMVAQAIGMGLLRKGGPLQGITTKAEWEALGYEVEGNFRIVDSPIQLRRLPETQRHPIDLEPELTARAGRPLTLKTFRDERQETEWVAQQVAEDVRGGLKPTDLLITALGGDNEKNFVDHLKWSLEKQDIKLWQPGVRKRGDDDPGTDFRREGHVTFANIHRAKGNEAWKVYAARFAYANQPLSWKKQETELHKRNEAFVALTRARIWCVVTGQEGPIFEEMRQAIEQQPVLRFPAFNRNVLKRIWEEDRLEESEAPILTPQLPA